LFLEICHADSGQGRGRVMLRFVLVNLVNRNGGVDDRWLDGLLVDNWLDGLNDEVSGVQLKYTVELLTS